MEDGGRWGRYLRGKSRCYPDDEVMMIRRGYEVSCLLWCGQFVSIEAWGMCRNKRERQPAGNIYKYNYNYWHDGCLSEGSSWLMLICSSCSSVHHGLHLGGSGGLNGWIVPRPPLLPYVTRGHSWSLSHLSRCVCGCQGVCACLTKYTTVSRTHTQHHSHSTFYYHGSSTNPDPRLTCAKGHLARPNCWVPSDP